MVKPVAAAETIAKLATPPIEETLAAAPAALEAPVAPVAPVAVAVAVEQATVVSEPVTLATSKPAFFDLKPVVKDAAPLEPNLDEAQDFVSAEQLEEAEPEVQEAISPFEISSTLTLEPQTNSIVFAEIPDPIKMSDIVTDAGLILRTGSIEIVPVTTGQIEVIPESPESDVADSMDSAASFVPSVAPLRASGVMNSKAQVGALPTRRRRVMDITVTSVTLGIVILALSAIGVISYMLGVLR